MPTSQNRDVGHPADILTPMNAPLLLSLGSAVVSLMAVVATFYGIRFTNKVNMQLQNDRLRFDERRQNQEMLRAKGEELFSLINAFEASFRKNAIGFSRELTASGRFNRDNTWSFVECTGLRQRIELLTKTYFPAANPQFERLATYEKALSSCMTQLSRTNSIGAEKTGNQLLLISVDVDANSIELQQTVIRLLQKLHDDVNEIHAS
jgi:hypothetical protein